jgi:20S proteasome alpha/beta subunit
MRVVSRMRLRSLALLLCLAPIACSSSSLGSAPWHDAANRSVRDADQYQDKPPTIFAPGGRLYSVEAIAQAVTSDSDCSSNTVIVLQCNAGVVAVTSLPVSPYMQYDVGVLQKEDGKDASKKEIFSDDLEESLLLLDVEEMGIDPVAVAPFCRVLMDADDHPVLALTAGNAVDAQALRHQMLKIADQMRAEGGADVDSDMLMASLARRLADQHQVRTQVLGKGRGLAAVAVLLSSSNSGTTIWRIDPAGQFWKCQAVVSGRHAAAAERLLWETLAAKQKRTDDKQQLSRTQIQTILSELTIEEALAIASKCIVAAQKQFGDRSKRGSSSPTVRLRGVSMNKDSHIVHTYTQSELLPLARGLA